MINPAADNYDRILPSLQKEKNTGTIATGNLRDFAFQRTRPPNNVASISSTADNYNLISPANQLTMNKLTIAAPVRGPIGVNSGVFPIRPVYSIRGDPYYPPH